MTKDMFLDELNRRLGNRPDKNDIISFYYEQITDRLENGESEAEIFSDLNVNEILLNLNETDSFEKEKAELNIPEPIVYKNTNEKVEINTDSYESESEEFTTSSSPENHYHGLSGGRKFWYVIWTIATVVFCVIAICIEVGMIFANIGFIAVIVGGGVIMSQSLGIGLLLVGVGLFLLGGGIIAVHFTKVLRKYMFSHRPKWNNAIYTNLGGK